MSDQLPTIRLGADEVQLADKVTGFLYWTTDEERLYTFVQSITKGMKDTDPAEMLRVASILLEAVNRLASEAQIEAEAGILNAWEPTDRKNNRVLLKIANRVIAQSSKTLLALEPVRKS